MNYDVLTCLVNISGLPAISIPGLKHDGEEVGLQIIGRRFDEKKIFETGKLLE